MKAYVLLSVAVMAVPERRAMVEELLASLGPWFPAVRVIYDEDLAGCWATAKRAWQAYPQNATHHLVLQDDALPCRDFLAGAAKACSFRPHHPITYTCWRETLMNKALAQGVSWIETPDGVYGQATSLPTWMIPRLMKWEEATMDPACHHDDARIARYCIDHTIPIYATVPALVQHGAPSDSLLGQDNARRIAQSFQAERSALSINWLKGLDNPVRGPLGCDPTLYRKRA